MVGVGVGGLAERDGCGGVDGDVDGWGVWRKGDVVVVG